MKVLVVDDQRSARRVLREMLSAADDVQVVEADGVDSALAQVDNELPDLLLLDVRLSNDVRDRGGLEILKKLRASGNTTSTVMVTSLTETAEIREAMRLGANDYVFKDDLSPEMIMPVIEHFRERMTLRADVLRLREKVDRTVGSAALVGSSPDMERLRKLIDRVADSASTVLIRGDTGSGKEMVARALHERSSRRDQPFLAVNCAAMPGSLIESMIFGHERGAFTGAQKRVRGQLELAGRGTLLLDEVAEMPPDLQAKLLRVLEERRFRPLGAESELPVHARVLAATHQDLEKRIKEGRFREDLFYRLNVVTLEVPTLGERLEDLPELVQSFVQQLPRKLTFTEDGFEWLKKRRWTGNVRELRNVIERLSLLSDTDTIDEAVLADLANDRRLRDAGDEIDRLAKELLALPDRIGSKLRAIERAILHHAIESCGGNKSAAARMVGVDRKSLERRWERLSEAPDEEEG